MAQPRDGNVSNRNNDGGSIDAEQILNSIIHHVEDSDPDAQPQASTSGDPEPAQQAGVPTKALAGRGESKKGHSKADFERIEKRAAELAAMLGGAGLSYSEAAKKHLDDFAETDREEKAEEPPLAVATIHSDDVSMESRSFDFHLDDFPTVNSTEKANKNKSVSDDLQKRHVSEWQADADADADADDADHLVIGAAEMVLDEPVDLERPLDAEQADPVDDPVDEALVQAPLLPVADEDEDTQMVSMEPSKELIDAENELVELVDTMVEEPPLPSDLPEGSAGAERSGAILNIAENIDLTEEKPEDAVPDLSDIEQQMEVMSITFKEAGAPGKIEEPVSFPSVEEGDAIAAGTQTRSSLMPEISELETVDNRVAELEAQIVELLDKKAQDNEALEERVAVLVRQETQTAVADAINSSPLFLSLTNSMKTIGEERALQETHMSDSLDALHDALKDLGERVSSVETIDKAGSATNSDEILPVATGIALPVPDGNYSAPDLNETVPAAHDIIDSEKETGPQPVLDMQDELPTWLEDATEDLLQEERSVVDQKADVFASRGVPARDEAQAPLISQEDKSQLCEPESDRSGLLSTNMPQRSGEDHQIGGAEAQPAQVVPPEGADHQPQSQGEADEIEVLPPRLDPAEPEMRVEAPAPVSKPKENDFLATARAAARQANDRIKQENGSKNEKKENGGRIFKALTAESADSKEAQKISFIEQAKQKQLEAGDGAVPLKPAGNRSLFADKVEGPNSLLVFTSLILFGTSALLLYGMSRNSQGAGETTRVNAVERQLDKNSVTGPTGKTNGDRVNGGAGGASHLSKQKKNTEQKSREQKRSDTGAQTSKIAGSLQKPLSDGGTEKVASSTDTLSDYDRMVGSGIATIPPVYTGTAMQPLSKDKAGSLFKEDIGFSRAATPLKAVTSLKKKPKGATSLLVLASQGDAQAQYRVAHRYGNGKGVTKNPALSVEWFEKSAKAGYVPAIYRLATMYERGTGVVKNYRRAMELYKSAAGKGNIKAMHNLAVLYMGGHLGKGDFKSAVKWYKEAADYGVRDSQFNLAIIFHNGLANKVDLIKAYKWYKLAALAGDEEARDIASDLLQELSDAQKKQVNGILGNWKKKTPDKNANAPQHFGKA